MDAHGLITHGLALALALCMVVVIISDAAHYIIPNWLNGLVALLFVGGAVAGVADPVSGLMAAGALLALGLVLFTLGLMGGGDVKLLVVCALWTGFGRLTVEFIFLTSVMGGALVILTLMLRKIIPPIWLRLAHAHALPRLLTRGEAVPYGIAIAAAFLWLLARGAIVT